VDALIDPINTRDWLARGLDVVDHHPTLERFNLGVIQT
jgi:acetyl-CoA carboxylase carboxyltransferase component